MASRQGHARPPSAQTSRPEGVSSRIRRWAVTTGSVLWASIPLLSLGLFSPIPIIHAAAKLRRPRLWLLAAAYAGVTAFAWVTVPAAEVDDATVIENLAVGAVLALAVGGTVHAFLLRRRVFGHHGPVEPAVAQALAARRRRQKSRSLAERDPALARELHIGRPDLPRDFDDGGLVDVNHVPPGILVTQLGFSTGQAAQVIQRRTSIGGFTNIRELETYCDLPPTFVDGLSDRLLFLP